MNERHVIQYFTDWYENRLKPGMQKDVSEHLDKCDRCRHYFQKMSEVLNKPNSRALPHLKPDPWLATKVRNNLKKGETPAGRPLRRFEWAFVGFVASLLICIGVYIGGGETNTTVTSTTGDNITVVTDTTQNAIANDYYQAFSQTNMADQWASVLEDN